MRTDLLDAKTWWLIGVLVVFAGVIGYEVGNTYGAEGLPSPVCGATLQGLATQVAIHDAGGVTVPDVMSQRDDPSVTQADSNSITFDHYIKLALDCAFAEHVPIPTFVASPGARGGGNPFDPSTSGTPTP